MRDARKLSRWVRIRRAGMTVLLAGLPGGFVGGCDEDCLLCSDCGSPNAPVDVYSVTGDEEVWLYWTPVDVDAVDVRTVGHERSPLFPTIPHLAPTCQVGRGGPRPIDTMTG